MVELELLAAVWAARKTRIYTMARPTLLLTDHQPLVKIINEQGLDQISNPRILRLKEKLLPYPFTAKWKKGSLHVIPDTFSRYPVAGPDQGDRRLEEELSDAICATVLLSIRGISSPISVNTGQDSGHHDVRAVEWDAPDLHVVRLRKAIQQDENYRHLADAIQSGYPEHPSDYIKCHHKIWEDLTVGDDGVILFKDRILIPKALRRQTLLDLHASHLGAEATKRRARQTIYWPSITSDIDNMISACDTCAFRSPSQPREELRLRPDPTADEMHAFHSVSADLFSFAGRTYLAYVDARTQWMEIEAWDRAPTSADIINTLRTWFVRLGVPTTFQSDNGPQFVSVEFKQFLEQWAVQQVLSSPYNPRSNGLAESAVKRLKKLVASTSSNINSTVFLRGLLEARNTPNQDGASPAQLLFGHNLRSFLPARQECFAPCWQTAKSAFDKRAARLARAKDKYDASAHPLRPIPTSTTVRIQDPISKKWTRRGVIVAKSRDRSYQIRLPSGNLIQRTRQQLRPVVVSPDQEDAPDPSPPPTTPTPEATGPTPATDSSVAPPSPPRPRRSVRNTKKPSRFLDDDFTV